MSEEQEFNPQPDPPGAAESGDTDVNPIPEPPSAEEEAESGEGEAEGIIMEY